ncbi:patatin-like phospholipase family protein [sulfur-oxidizing endosymbiont of Gigantopelta aegis]|uniref:patatin-like phospholipase family protein n=1 Tax=sulfur-oxidizing endosymbiont of Gigantopelta aegis TaxID=2794934 RepID=UPI0018DB9620|nr:patatin-like phospholipase family protein [sulfur-oxidizing endosymbiont of Gigantopelta aegis]
MNKKLQLLFMSLILLIVAGCSTTAQRNPLPVELMSKASIPGIPNARFWADEWPKFSIKRFDTMTEEDMNKLFSGVYNRPHNYLAISGGGSNGAFGAGLLAGWAATGTRPEFTMVTGVSTGALTAPFAFLGADYDDELKKVYTTTKTSDIAIDRNLISGMLSDSLADTAPLKKLIQRYVSEDVIAAIAKEHLRGRRLFVGTVNLDASRSVIWNIGAIASSDYPGKVDLIHEVLRASAAIPVAFPPVMIPVEVNGRQYDEMHVDGGTGSQVFVYPAAVDWQQITRKLKVQGKPEVYIIRNSFLDPDYNGIIPSLMPIASRSIDSLIRTQGVGDLYQIYALCERDGNEFNLAYIPSDFTDKPTEGFDPVYMTKLYQHGYNMAVKGYTWKKGPPGFIKDSTLSTNEK